MVIVWVTCYIIGVCVCSVLHCRRVRCVTFMHCRCASWKFTSSRLRLLGGGAVLSGAGRPSKNSRAGNTFNKIRHVTNWYSYRGNMLFLRTSRLTVINVGDIWVLIQILHLCAYCAAQSKTSCTKRWNRLLWTFVTQNLGQHMQFYVKQSNCTGL